MADRPATRSKPDYILRAPTSGAGVLEPRTSVWFWGGGSMLLGMVVTWLLIQGQIRPIVLILLSFLALASLAPRRGVYVLILFLPFMYFLRRMVLNFQQFDQRDPILLFPVITALLMLLGMVTIHRRTVLDYFGRSPLLKACACLMGWMALEVLNPLQGSLLVGIGGAMFFLVPMAWCFFGLLITREALPRILRIVVGIGFVTAVYGLKQHFFGLAEVELYELKAKHFLKTFGSVDTVRIMSTFASLGDFSFYQSFAGFLAFALFWRRKRSPFLLLTFLLSIYTMVWMAVRTAFLLQAFSIMVLLILHGSNVRRIVVRCTLALIVITTFYAMLGTYDPDRMYDQQFSTNPYVVHTLSGLTHPTQESSLQGRLVSWGGIVASAFTAYPVGHGIGSTTIAAGKFEGGSHFETDSYFFALFYGSGIPAPFLFGIIVFFCLRNLLQLCLADPDDYLSKVALAVLCGAFLGSVFGGAVNDAMSGPLCWLVIGWSVREHADRFQAGSPALARAVGAA